jgi:hypothetical protein
LVEFLGHVFSAEGILQLPASITAIRAHLPPSYIRELQGFLGLFSFYRRFMKDAVCLYPASDRSPERQSQCHSSGDLETPAKRTAFQAAKGALANLCRLEHPSALTQLSMATDALVMHVGGRLQQIRETNFTSSIHLLVISSLENRQF